MVAMRYLRARRQEGFISVIAWVSLTGIALGVATLIIVMAVMNGFRQELLTRILGINGHLSVYGQTNQIAAFDPIAEKLRAVEGVKIVSPMVEGQVMATANGVAQGGVVRGFRPRDLSRRKIIIDNIREHCILLLLLHCNHATVKLFFMQVKVNSTCRHWFLINASYCITIHIKYF